MKERIKWKEPLPLCKAGLLIIEGKHWGRCVLSVLGKVGRSAVEQPGVGCELWERLELVFSKFVSQG